MPETVADLRHRLQLIRKACQEIGEMPPRPSGLRAAIGGIAVSVMRRLMFWYAPAVQRAIGALTDVVDDLLRDLRDLDGMIRQDGRRITAVEERMQSLRSQLEAPFQLKAPSQLEKQLLETMQQDHLRITAIEQQLLMSQQERELQLERQSLQIFHEFRTEFEGRLLEAIQQERSHITAIERQLLDAVEQHRPQTDALEARLNEQARTLELERATTIGIEGDFREQTEDLQQLVEERRQKEEELEARLRDYGDRLQLLRRETVENERRLARLLEEVRRRDQAPAELQRRPFLARENVDGLDAFEAALESEIRGVRSEAQARWKAYVPLMPRDGLVLDLGCGRGEWLELLRQEGISARGVDSNSLMVAECRERFLDAEQAEALEYLARTPDGSLAAVTVLRLLERFPLRKLVRLVDEVLRVLRPGGAAIFESPNPDNILTASRDFYRDPRRRHPIPSEVLSLLLSSRGLETVQTLFLNPAPDDERVPDEGEGAVARRFNRFFYGPRDYAVVSRKPSLS